MAVQTTDDEDDNPFAGEFTIASGSNEKYVDPEIEKMRLVNEVSDIVKDCRTKYAVDPNKQRKRHLAMIAELTAQANGEE